MRCVCFTLYGPLCSWGSISVAEVRRSWGRPSKSAVLGLVAAAKGIDRNDEERHARLQRDWALGLRVDSPGTSLLDYHTVQYPPSTGKRTFFTRRDELVQKLAKGEQPDTKVLSRREYLQDAVFTVCLWPVSDHPDPDADDIAHALKNPFFTPYLGRRSCPPAVPFWPEVIDAPAPEAALAAYKLPYEVKELITKQGEAVEAYLEVVGDLPEEGEILERRDAIHSRTARQFAMRREVHRTLPRAEIREG